MIRTLTLTAVTATLLLSALPITSAEWMSYGTSEPDTPYDSPTYMWQDAPGAAKNRVYFNAYPKWGDSGANGAFLNPNVGALGTRFDLAGQTSYHAVLGVWTDCNGDGYIGMAETAVREYKAELLPAGHICPGLTGKTQSWPPGQNNYNGWVTELIPIGGRDYTPNDDKRVYADPEAMVWGDSGRPEADAPQAGASCPIFPLPGDAHSTGGLIRTVDCRGNRGYVERFNELDATLGTGLGDPYSSGTTLNQTTFGDDGSEHSAVYFQDCSADPLLNTGDIPVGDDFDNVDIIRPVPANPVNTDTGSWTVPGTLNATRESITVLWQQNVSAEPGSDPEANCDYTDDNGGDFYGNIEANAVINQEGGKRNAQWNFFFNTASRGTLPATGVAAGSAGASTDLGIEALGIECTSSSCVQSAWIRNGGDTLYTPPVFRGTLTDATVNGDETQFAEAPHWSFYAFVGSATTTRGFVLPGGGATTKYGVDQCGANTDGEHHGWNCDPTEWYLLADGTNSQDTTTRPLAKVGQPYNLRDVDCLDGSIEGMGAGISPAFFGDEPCA